MCVIHSRPLSIIPENLCEFDGLNFPGLAGGMKRVFYIPFFLRNQAQTADANATISAPMTGFPSSDIYTPLLMHASCIGNQIEGEVHGFQAWSRCLSHF